MALLSGVSFPISAACPVPSDDTDVAVGIRLAPPFVTQSSIRGQQGFALELWQSIANELLLEGYGYNLLIAALAMVAGTLTGCLAGVARHARHPLLKVPGRLVSSVYRNVPSFVLMFYIAFVIPVEIQWGGTLLQVPLWIKATLAPVIPVIAIDNSPEFLLLVYGYVCLWFLLTGQAVSRGIQALQRFGHRDT
ncbi:MAG: hypothetical protein AB7E12_16190 [Burkholderiaceae bacterium]